jgi:hypothetical protein
VRFADSTQTDGVLLWQLLFGAIAQLVERFHGMEEARGSNPLSSTYLLLGAFDGSGPQDPSAVCRYSAA